MPKCYIAGPMRGLPDFNFPTFHQAAALGRSLGWECISPAEEDVKHGFTPTGVDPDYQFNHSEIRAFARRDASIILDELKAEVGDAIAVLPGYERSTGARAEIPLGQWVKLAILDATTFQPFPPGHPLGRPFTPTELRMQDNDRMMKALEEHRRWNQRTNI